MKRLARISVLALTAAFDGVRWDSSLCPYERVYQSGRRAHEVLDKLKSIPFVKEETSLLCHRLRYDVRLSMLARSLGYHHSGATPPINCNRDQYSCARGVVRRILIRQPQIDPGRLRRFRSFVRMYLRTEARQHGLLPLERVLTLEEWLETTHYPKWRKDELRIAEQLLRAGLTTKAATEVVYFSKLERLEGAKENRGICARVDPAKVEFGPLIKSIETEVYSKIPEFVKHAPVYKYPQMISERCEKRPGDHVVATDYTSFEGHFHPKLMRYCECELYSYMLRSCKPDECRKMCDVICGLNKVRSKLLSFQVKGCRMSGDMMTSLGNGFTNLMVMKFLCHELGSAVQGFVEGDDGIFRIVGRVPTESDYAGLGFCIKIDHWDEPELASFCGQVYSPTVNEVVVDPIYTILASGWTVSDQRHGGPVVLKGLARAKAISLAYQCPNSPVVSSFCRALLRITAGVDPRWPTLGGMRDYWELHVTDGKLDLDDEVKAALCRGPSLESRRVCERVYGVPIHHQLELEKFFDSWRVLKPWSHPLFDIHIPPDYFDFHKDHTHVFRKWSRWRDIFSSALDPAYGFDVRGLGFTVVPAKFKLNPARVGDEASRVFEPRKLVGRPHVWPSLTLTS